MKHCRALALALSLGFAPIVAAQEGLQVAYNAVLTDYGFLMSKAEFCGLSTRFSLKYDVLTALAGKVDLLRVESDLDQAHRAERDRLPDDCQPDDVSLWARSFERSLDMLIAVIENGGNYPDTPRTAPAPATSPQAMPPSSANSNPTDSVATTSDRSTIQYGSRAGMTLTVVSASGLDTAEAKIEARLTKEDAAAFCAEYLQDNSEECIAKRLRESNIEPSITANCETGVFSNFGGRWHQFLGPKNVMYGDTAGSYTILDLEMRTAADGSSASGYDTNLGLYRELCPSKVPYYPLS